MSTLALFKHDSQYFIQCSNPTLPSISQNAESDYQTVDREIDLLQSNIQDRSARLRAWQSHRNDLAIISRLPNEILIEIWKYLAFNDTHSIAWIRITHVCSKWRQTAINCPTLWRKPYLKHRELALEMIRRAKKVSLCLDIDSSDFLPKRYDEFQDVCRIVDKLLHRTQSLTLLKPLWTHHLRVKSVPALTELHVEHPASESMYTFLFSMQPAKLECVSLVDCGLLNRPQSIHPCQTAKMLLIDNTPKISAVRIRRYTSSSASLRNALASLSKFPNLESLTIYDVFDIEGEATDSNSGRQTVKLPKLSSISIRAPLKICSRFLGSIICCSYTEFFVDATGACNVPGLQTPDDLQDIFISTLGGLAFDVDRLSIKCIEDGRFYGYIFERTKWKGPGSPKVTIWSSVEQIQAPKLHPQLMGLPYLKNLKSLFYDSPHQEHSTQGFWEACGRLPKLRHLNIYADHPELMKVLSTQPVPYYIRRSPPYFPAMKYLHLRQHWRRQKNTKDLPVGDPDEEESTWLCFSATASANFAVDCEWNSWERGLLYGERFKYEVLEDSQHKS